MNFEQILWNKVFFWMFGLVVIEGLTLSGHLSNINEINTYLCTAVKSKTWQMIPTEKIGTRKYTDSGTNCIEMTIHATSIIISHRASALTPIECSTQQQHRLTWQHAIFCFLGFSIWMSWIIHNIWQRKLYVLIVRQLDSSYICQWMERDVTFVSF